MPGEQQERSTDWFWVKIFRQIKRSKYFIQRQEAFLPCAWNIWTVHYKLKGKLSSTEKEFWRWAERNSRLVKLRNEASRETMQVTHIFGENGQHVHTVWTLCVLGG